MYCKSHTDHCFHIRHCSHVVNIRIIYINGTPSLVHITHQARHFSGLALQPYMTFAFTCRLRGYVVQGLCAILRVQFRLGEASAMEKRGARRERRPSKDVARRKNAIPLRSPGFASIFRKIKPHAKRTQSLIRYSVLEKNRRFPRPLGSLRRLICEAQRDPQDKNVLIGLTCLISYDHKADKRCVS